MRPPTVIYLQWLDDDGEEAEEVTWCVDRINDTDIEYRLVEQPYNPASLTNDPMSEVMAYKP